jgi:GH24 family phage-related lysozyme (muramidase)
MRMTLTGRWILEHREGCDLKARLSGIPGDPWTIGFGHTHFDGPPIPVEGMTITQAEADAMLTRDLVRYENIVNTNIKVPLADHEFDALVSLCYNVEHALSPESSIVKALNAGSRVVAGDAFLLYNIPTEIVGRRRSERWQFLTPYKQIVSPVIPTTPIPVQASPATGTPGAAVPAATAAPGSSQTKGSTLMGAIIPALGAIALNPSVDAALAGFLSMLAENFIKASTAAPQLKTIGEELAGKIPEIIAAVTANTSAIQPPKS